MKFNFTNIFKKQPTTSQVMMTEIKTAAIGSIQGQMSNLISGILSGVNTFDEQKKYRIIMKGKAVEEVHADPKEEQDDQDAIYTEFMAMMNGDPDIEYDVPDEIEIKAFDNDSRTEEERDEIYNLIDAMNEANEIKRTGTFRTPESVRKEEEESRKKAEAETNRSQTNNVKNIVMEAIKPIFGMMTVMISSMFALTFVAKMSSILDKISIQ